MKEKDIQDLQNAIDSVENVQTKEQAQVRIKELKKEIRKLEVAVITIGLVILGLIVLPFFSIISFNVISVLSILGGIALIVKAFKDGEILELEKFFLELVYTQSNNTKDGE